MGDRFKSFDGIPHPYDKKKRLVVPHALKNLRMKPTRKFCKLGDMATKVGWNNQELIAKLEERRQVKSRAYFVKKLSKKKADKDARAAVASKANKAVLEPAGYM